VIVPDANLLLYAYDAASPFHEPGVAWWEDCLSGTERVGLCTVVLFAFVRIGTSRRVFADPLSIDEAAARVQGWLGRSVTEILTTEARDVSQALEWLQALGAVGNLPTDAQIAAIAARDHATVHTADTDFARFPGVRWRNPLLDG
jgi:toxin-antitoxin system PIN domain toxin